MAAASVSSMSKIDRCPSTLADSLKKMSEGVDSAGPLPPGWEIRYDARTRRHYYIDNYNRTTTWEDPRPRYRSLLQQNCPQASPSHSSIAAAGEMTTVQHGSLEFRGSSTVYPSYASYPPPPQPAFQLPPTPFSHLAPSSTIYQELGSSTRPSPVMTRSLGKIMGTSAFGYRLHQGTVDTSLTPNTDELVAKIGAIFPTVGETHIKCLLKKYHNREAVVISALQVEKHPITTPGPFSTPPQLRNVHTSDYYTPIQMTPPLSIRGTPPAGGGTPPVTIRGSIATPPLGLRGSPPTRGSSPVPRPSSSASSYYGSPRLGDYKQSPRPHSSPKMKLRYLKSVFPKVEETLLLDILATEDNNVMKAAEKLKALGFEKRDTPPPRLTLRKKEEEALAMKKTEMEKEKMEMQKPTPPPRMKTLEEKGRMQARLQGLYSEIPERLIQIAMESAEYDEEKARHILMLQMHEEKENKPEGGKAPAPGEEGDVADSSGKKDDSSSGKATCSRQIGSKKETSQQKKDGIEKKTKSKKEIPKVSRGTSTTEDQEFKSPYLQKPDGRNSSLRKGPNDQLLLPDYMTWNGPNPDLRTGHDKTLAKGPNKSILSEKRFTAKGANKDLRKGPALGLAKGSIYSQMSGCIVGESRGQ